MPVCVSEDAVLRPPVTLDFVVGTQVTSPFVLNGAPMTNRPSSLPNSGEYRRTATALVNPKTPKYYNMENYYTVNLNTKNIIGPESFGNTTMRYDGENYTLNYMALHAPIWPSLESKPQLSLVLTTAEFKILHLCIPINLTDSDAQANPFLRYWLYDESPLPSGFTVNEILNFSQPTVTFATLQYCLKYNNSEDVTPYVFCVFKDGLNINAAKAPAWIRNLSTPDTFPAEGSTTSYMRKTSDAIFNLMMHGQFRYFMRDVKDPRLISVEQHFSDDRTQTAINPVNYTVNRELLFKKKTSGSVEGFSGQINLQNVKCYPINLNTQIDDNGSVVIDQTTKKPVDLKSIDSSMYKSLDPSTAYAANEAAQLNNNTLRYYAILLVVGLIVLCIVIALIVYVFSARSVAAAKEAVEVVISQANAAKIPLPASPRPTVGGSGRSLGSTNSGLTVSSAASSVRAL
jgi:hypothetical protein